MSPILPKKDHGTCRSCRARILWAKTAKGANMPLDCAPSPDGNFFALEQPDPRAALEAVPVDELSVRAGEARRMGLPRFAPHWASCPHAAEHRRPR